MQRLQSGAIVRIRDVAEDLSERAHGGIGCSSSSIFSAARSIQAVICFLGLPGASLRHHK